MLSRLFTNCLGDNWNWCSSICFLSNFCRFLVRVYWEKKVYEKLRKIVLPFPIDQLNRINHLDCEWFDFFLWFHHDFAGLEKPLDSDGEQKKKSWCFGINNLYYRKAFSHSRKVFSCTKQRRKKHKSSSDDRFSSRHSIKHKFSEFKWKIAQKRVH